MDGGWSRIDLHSPRNGEWAEKHLPPVARQLAREMVGDRGRGAEYRTHGLALAGRPLARVRIHESGRFEIYVQAYPVSAGKIRVSVDGGTKARWAKNSIGCISSIVQFMVSTVTTHPELRSDVPRPAFNEPLLAQDSGIRLYDVGPDGRILAIKEDDSVRSDHIIVVQNWLSEVRALLSAPRR